MNELMKDKALLVVIGVGVFASGYYFHEYNVFSMHENTESTYSTSYDTADAIQNDLSAGAAASIDNINLGDDVFGIEDISQEEDLEPTVQ